MFIVFSTTLTVFSQEVYRSEYFGVLTFWESPYIPFKGAYPITKEIAKTRINTRLDYDNQNRVIKAHVKIGKHYKEFEGRFGSVSYLAPLTTIEYAESKETHRFFDRHGNQTIARGGFYTKVYTKDRYGRNISLKFYNEQGQETQDMFGMMLYQWKHQTDGSIIEERFDNKGDLAPLRRDFELLRTKMTFDDKGYFGTLQNVDENGDLTETSTGVATLKYFYDQYGRFARWEVEDSKGNPAIGASGTAGEQNKFLNYDLESINFFDKDGKPATHWSGAERWHYKLDKYGNRISLTYQYANGTPKTTGNGFASIHYQWSKNGRYLLSQSFMGDQDEPIIVSSVGFHKQRMIRNKKGLIVKLQFLDTDGNLVNRKDNGVAQIVYEYDKNNKRIGSQSQDKEGKNI